MDTGSTRKINFLAGILLAVCLIIFTGGCGRENAAKNDFSVVSGRLDIKGSDTLLQTASSLAEAFMEKNPDADITVAGGGSGTGIASLLNGEIALAGSSRDVQVSETESASRQGKEFYQLIVARDGLSIIAHRDNPVNRLTTEEVGRIFRGEITNWREVGGGDAAITLYGRQSTSGTYEFMQDKILRGDHAAAMRNLEGNQAIIDAVRGDRTGIGYVGIAYAAESGSGIRAFDIAAEEGGTYYSPLMPEYINSGVYPITRPLYQVIMGLPEPGGLINEFLRFEASQEGRSIIAASGYCSPNQGDDDLNRIFFDKIGGK